MISHPMKDNVCVYTGLTFLRLHCKFSGPHGSDATNNIDSALRYVDESERLKVTELDKSTRQKIKIPEEKHI